jgi:hypothetical protein
MIAACAALLLLISAAEHGLRCTLPVLYKHTHTQTHTTVYFIGEEWLPGMGGELKLSHTDTTNSSHVNSSNSSSSGSSSSSSKQGLQPVVIEPLPDRLVLFRSRDVWNERTVVHNDAQWAVIFWIHGQEEGQSSSKSSSSTTRSSSAKRVNSSGRSASVGSE